MIGVAEEKSEIVTIFNKYKSSLDDLIDSSDKEFLDQLGLIDKGSCNLRSKGSLMGHLERDYCLDSKDILDTSLGLEFKTQDSEVYQYYDIVLLDLKSGKV